LKNLFLTIIGGMGLFIATVILNAFVSSPPSRAEFNSFKAEQTLQNRHIEGKLDEIKKGQDRLIDKLL